MRRQAAHAIERDIRSETAIAPIQSVGFMDAAPKREKICRFPIARSTTTDTVRRARTPRRFAPASTTSIGSVARAAEGALERGVAAPSPFQTRKLMVPGVLLFLILLLPKSRRRSPSVYARQDAEETKSPGLA